MAFKYFTIFGAMRTGSNLLERSLDQYAGLSGHGELFNPQFIGKPDRREFLTMPLADRNADPIGLLNLLVEASPHAIPGFRIFDNHDQRVIDFAARDPNCAKIILRRNPCRQLRITSDCAKDRPMDADEGRKPPPCKNSV